MSAPAAKGADPFAAAPEHAVLGASGAYRYMACPGSVKLSDGLPHGQSSHYAEEGTAAHMLGEQCLRENEWPRELIGQQITTPEGSTFTVDQDMANAVHVYVEHCGELVEQSDHYGLEANIDLGPLLRFSGLEEPAYGTADFWSLTGNLLEVCDYKHGKGVPVSPVENVQLMFYGLGVLIGCRPGSVKTVRLTIIQPRSGDPAPESWEILADDLLQWGMRVLVPAMQLALSSDPPLCAGDWCRFCPARVRCPELRRQAEKAAQAEFAPMPPKVADLTDAELGEVLDKAELISIFVSAIRGEASTRVEAGKNIPGWKLVPKRAVRKWNDPDAVSNYLKGFPACFEKPKIKSVAQVEKALNPQQWADTAAKYVVKESSGSTLVPDGDPRERVEAKIQGSEFDPFVS